MLKKKKKREDQAGERNGLRSFESSADTRRDESIVISRAKLLNMMRNPET
jgi:hypothetical protein